MDGLQLTDVSDARLLLVAAAVAVVLVAVVMALRSRRRAGPMVGQTQLAPKMQGSLDAGARRRVSVELGREILALLETGRRAEAVALVRETTGWGAAEADEAVVRLESLRKKLES